jgi:RNA polymerase sigma-70 factor (ECF subfamily)
MARAGCTVGQGGARDLGCRHAMVEAPTTAEHLLPRVALGDADAVEACLQRYTPLVWSLAKRLSRDVSTLEVVVQEIFIDLWKSAGRFDPAKASEATFIATVARRRVIDRQRRTARTPLSEPVLELSASADEPGFERVDAVDEARRATAALARLRPVQRRLILMSVVHGLTHREIAATTGLPLGTVKSDIRRGLERAAQLLRRPPEGAES